MKSKYATLKSIINYVRTKSSNPINELLTMGFDPYQLVNVFGFDADDVKKSDAYRNGNWNLDQKEDPFRLDLYEPFDAALVSRFKLTNEQFSKFKDTTVYTQIYNSYMDEKADCETELFNGIFDENEDNILEELEFLKLDEDIEELDGEDDTETEDEYLSGEEVAAMITSENTQTEYQFCIIGVTEHFVRKYYSVSKGWIPEAKDATVFKDQDTAHEIWGKLDKTGFKRVFVPNFDPTWINDTSNKKLSDAIDFLKIADPKHLEWCKNHATGTSDTQLILYAQSLKQKSGKCVRVLCPENVDNVLEEPWQYVALDDTDSKKPLIEITSEASPKNPKTISLASDGEEYYLLVTGTDYELPLFKEDNQTLAEAMENLILGLR